MKWLRGRRPPTPDTPAESPDERSWAPPTPPFREESWRQVPPPAVDAPEMQAIWAELTVLKAKLALPIVPPDPPAPSEPTPEPLPPAA